MYPTILRIGSLGLHSWGLLLAIAFLVGIAVAYRRAQTRNVRPQKIVDLAVVVIVAAVVGGRIAFVLGHLPDFRETPLEVFAIWRGGMTFYGGAILAFVAGVLYVKRHKLNVWQVADIIAPSLAFGLFLARIGCFLNGCCFGEPTQLPWGIVFPYGSYAEQIYGSGVHIHPTQLYSSLAGLAMFFLLFWMEKWWLFDGSLFWRFVIMYSLWRIYVDVLRYCEPSTLHRIGGLTVTESQLISAGLLVVSAIMLLLLSRAKRRATRARR
jgi:phosphatidylglycerol:prolipoprotein diacylglycerol transferase